MKIGDKINASKLGYKTWDLMIWIACPCCKEERWLRFSHYKKGEKLECKSCAKWGSSNPRWIGARIINAKGYAHVPISRNSEFYPMAVGRRGRVLEHRLVMAQSLGRPLLSSEVVHHKNSIRHDNRLENLELIDCKGRHNTHDTQHMYELIREVKRLSAVIKKQTQEIKDLKAAIKKGTVTTAEQEPTLFC